MSSYENDQARLQKFWDEMMSDESDFSPDVSEYEPSSSDTSDLSDNQEFSKKCKKSNKGEKSKPLKKIPVKDVPRECEKKGIPDKENSSTGTSDLSDDQGPSKKYFKSNNKSGKSKVMKTRPVKSLSRKYEKRMCLIKKI